ncbi:hypothetical protein IRT38_00680 (plasmid) [Acinetobacter sp. SK-43]|uniref:hypothetical protein n=1 Tax=Acinetobacter sp. SK-43 TaxID=2785295 RepID=UPI00188A8883|nr:hypothetical protein [Acinetobacter sp. SK-43]MBF4453930.1 hypothetical protein [Acinetobacter sp. SK-43]
MRIGKIQRAILNWVGNNRIFIGATSERPDSLKGYTLDEIQPSLNKLIERNLLISSKHGFYEKSVKGKQLKI